MITNFIWTVAGYEKYTIFSQMIETQLVNFFRMILHTNKFASLNIVLEYLLISLMENTKTLHEWLK